MSIYNISNDGIEEVRRTNFQQMGILERNHLQTYFRDKIEIISPNTLIISEEFSEWDESRRRIDLLGIDKNANLIVIELKRTETGDYMELQALRYASMISTMSFERCISIYQKYIDRRLLGLNAEEELLSFLDWDIPVEEDFASDVKLVLASANFSKELTSSVLWLINKGIDIKCVKLTLYQHKEDLLLDVSQIIPLSESEDYLIKIKEKNEERKKVIESSRDNTKYLFNGLLLGKGRFVLAVVREYLNQNSKTFEELKQIFLDEMQGSTGVINTMELIRVKYNGKSKKRHFVKEDEILSSSDNIDFAVSTEWGIGNIHNILKFAVKEGFQFEEK